MIRTATNTTGDTFATIETVDSVAGPFFNIRLFREELPDMRLQIAHSDIERRTKEEISEAEVLERHLVQSLARFGFTRGDLK
jgi:hypothetical protein